MTALHWAAREDHAHIAEQLLQNKADYTMKTRKGELPIDFALRSGGEDSVCVATVGLPFPHSPTLGRLRSLMY